MNAHPQRYLVLEDEPFIALDLQLAFEDVGSIASLAATCEQALEILESTPVKGAVLDVNLGHGERCWEIADRLQELGIPYLLHTGDLNREGEHIRRLSVPIVAKPALAETVVEQLLRLIRDQPTD